MPSENSLIAVHGHEKRRGCTDVVFLAALLAGVGYLFFVLHHSRVNGDFDKIIYGQDYMADLCGRDNSVEATGLPAIIEVTRDDSSWANGLPFFNSEPGSQTSRILRGQRDHRERPYLFYTLPVGTIDRYESIPICVAACPGNSSSSGATDPGSWVCTGKYTDGPPASCPDGQGDAAECVAYRKSFFLDASDEALDRCRDPLADCDICYPCAAPLLPTPDPSSSPP